MSGCIVSAFADEYADDFGEQLAVLRELGIPRIELRHINGKNVIELNETELDGVARALRTAGVTVSAIGSPIGKIRADEDIEGHIRAAGRIFAAARLLGTRYVRIFSLYPPRNAAAADWRDTVYRMTERLMTLAEGYGVTLCHENEAGIWGESPERCLELLRYFGGRLRCVFDMGNFVLAGYDPSAAYRILAPYIAYFHIKDALYAGAVVPAGCGEARIADILTQHEKYSGTAVAVTLEPHLQTFSGLNALTGRAFDNPYKYADRKAAFSDAYVRFKALMGGAI